MVVKLCKKILLVEVYYTWFLFGFYTLKKNNPKTKTINSVKFYYFLSLEISGKRFS